MKDEEEKIKELYDNSVKFLPFYYLDGVIGRATEGSIYRKRTIATLGIKPDSKILDVACGIGFNFKIIEQYLQNRGKLIGIDISPESLKLASRIIKKNSWKNTELVKQSIIDYEPEIHFDAILCTQAMEVIPDYKGAIDKIYTLLKEHGRFAILGMKLSSQYPYKILNPFFNWLYTVGGINNLDRDIVGYIESKFNKIDYYESCFLGYYYILSTDKS